MRDRLQVLVVEDEPLVAWSIQDTLESHGFAVACAENGRRAIDCLDHSYGLSAVVTDIRLGEGPNGWDVAGELEKRTRPSRLCT